MPNQNLICYSEKMSIFWRVTFHEIIALKRLFPFPHPLLFKNTFTKFSSFFCGTSVAISGPGVSAPFFCLGMMAVIEKISQCVLWYAESISFVMVQCSFQREYRNDSPDHKVLFLLVLSVKRDWLYSKGKTTGSPYMFLFILSVINITTGNLFFFFFTAWKIKSIIH